MPSSFHIGMLPFCPVLIGFRGSPATFPSWENQNSRRIMHALCRAHLTSNPPYQIVRLSGEPILGAKFVCKFSVQLYVTEDPPLL